jgi:hypothetical protein
MNPMCYNNLLSSTKDTVRPTTGHEGIDGEYRSRSTLSLTSALYGVGDQRHKPAASHPGKDTGYPLYRRVGGPQGPVWAATKNLVYQPGVDPRTVQPIASRYTA